MNNNRGIRKYFTYLGAVLWNLILVFFIYFVGRIVFYLVNRPTFSYLDFSSLMKLCLGGLRFDTSAAFYTNILYVILMLIPFRFREKPLYQAIAKWLFVLTNAVTAILVNIADAVYFPFTGHRTTWSVFSEFQGDDNLGGIIWHETLSHWYLVLLGLGLLLLLIYAYRRPSAFGGKYRWNDYLGHSLVLLAAFYPLVCGLRGGFGMDVHPISINDASLYIEKPEEAGIVLNTPFCLYRTIDAPVYEEKNWYESKEALEEAFNPVHIPAQGGNMQKKNVIIIILESFATSYSAYQSSLQDIPQKGCMPFLDSLMREGMIFRYSFANGRMSIDAQPSIMCGIPSFVDSYVLTPYVGNHIRGLAQELKEKGYSSAFYHGAQRQSLAMAGFAHKTGFMNEYSRESFNDESYFDGTWGIWDEPFLQYFEQGIGQLQEPFLASIFTLSSHHPFKVPAQYESVFPPTEVPIHRCVSYSDMALRKFFESASKEEWFQNTVFVFTGDHSNMTDAPEYMTSRGKYAIPIFFYTPDGSLPKGVREGIAQQLDIKPTLFSLLGYDEPYFSFGCDLLTTPAEDTYAVYYQAGFYFYYQQEWQLQFDGEKSVGLYRFTTDHLLENNLLDEEPEVAARLEAKIKAIIQQYNQRMIHDDLIAPGI